MTNTSSSTSSRLDVVDALRGFAILSMFLLHNIEQYDLDNFLKQLPTWISGMDSKVVEYLFFLVSGKAYAIFALLFGFTFYIQFNNQQKKGNDFRGRFAWRLFLLSIIGIFNTLFYSGDILVLYAILGLALIPVSTWSNKAVLIFAAVLLAQPLEWLKFFSAYNNPAYVMAPHKFHYYYEQSLQYLTGESFIKLVEGNLFNGRLASLFWYWEGGRVFQTISLFFAGMMIGRTGKFIQSDSNSRFWKKMLFLSLVLTVLFHFWERYYHQLGLRDAPLHELDLIVDIWSNIAFMLLQVSIFITAYQMNIFRQILSILSPVGRMSLSNYVMQSIVGSFIYYGYGLGVYRFAGPTYSLGIGLLLCTLQIYFSRWWMKNHSQGPLENLWHRATWI